MPATRCRRFAIPLLFLFGSIAHAQEPKDFFKPAEPSKPVAGKSEMLRHVPKRFAILQSVDLSRREVTLLLEGDQHPKAWAISADAELKIHGWWGRLEQFTKGDRVWVWFDVDRNKQPRSVLMLADEISEQDIHGPRLTLEQSSGTEGDSPMYTVTLKPTKGASRTYRLGPFLNADKDGVEVIFWLKADGEKKSEHVKKGEKVFVQTSGDIVRQLVSERGLEHLRDEQRRWLRERWVSDGLPGMVTFLHRLGGEFDLMLDHEAIRWGRSLKNGDKVTIKSATPIEAVVKEVRPWRERTQLRLVADGFALADLTNGQRVLIHMATPPVEVDTAEMPPDIDRPRTKPERIDWFLASTYCSCTVRGDTCTGMFYTLASCNINACGMPNHIRGLVAGMIDKGMADRQIWDELKKSQGPLMLKQHLLP